ncbi:hypothetical protein Leryth_005574 [Lithospermum erythrorhizon]|nr:hypothetical protein Leryth_005574 [Lithospermum erythrorhizon]
MERIRQHINKTRKCLEIFGSVGAIRFEKGLDEASKSFDDLFCRTYIRVVVVHGVGEDLNYPLSLTNLILNLDDGKKPQ